MLKRVLAADSSWCREGPCINLRHGLARTNESRAWPGVAILIRRGGQRPWGTQTNFGWTVERDGGCHVSWRVQQRAVLWRAEVSMHLDGR
jgi:hypothetical protein